MPTRAEDIEREIEDTRAGMSRTAAAIERRLNPAGLVEDALSWLRGAPSGGAPDGGVAALVARNPLPVALIGIGTLWLAWEIVRGRSGAPEAESAAAWPEGQPASRHHAHVEDDGSTAAPGLSPLADELLGRRSGVHAASDAAEAFADSGDEHKGQ
jgi:hypothetical protein